MADKPLHLYVHIPFCVRKCHYCDFNSHEHSDPDWQAYQDSLIAELQSWAQSEAFSTRSIHTVFFGGGTPSLAPPSLIKAVLDTTSELFDCSADIEISLEANPGTIDHEHFHGYRQAGINRLSIGVQSLNNQELHWLERIHDHQQAVSAFEIARKAGFDNINLDLMYGLPDQSLDSWLNTLHQAIRLGPEHLSCYQLTVEEHTRLAKTHAQSPYPLPDEECALAFLLGTRKHLLDAGYQAYEVSNFSVNGKRCRHNDAYWLYRDYIGIGAGASGKWDTADGGIIRYSNLRTPDRYMAAASQKGIAINSHESLNREKAGAEAAWLGLRRSAGIDRNTYRNRFGVDIWECFSKQLQPWLTSGNIEMDTKHIKITDKGLPLTDTISSSLL